MFDVLLGPMTFTYELDPYVFPGDVPDKRNELPTSRLSKVIV